MEKPLKPTSFKTAKAFNSWLKIKGGVKTELWIRIYKKNSGIKSVTYQEALEEALCYGWIDGIRMRFDEDSFIQRFTPRTKKSIWSKRNTLIVEKLIESERMQSQGLLRVNEAKADGRWEKAYTGNPHKDR